MDLVCGKDKEGIHILENGNLEKQMVMVFIHGLMAIDMKVNSNNV
jgi:hypothetical protein